MTHAHEFPHEDDRPDYEVRLALLESDFPNANWSPITRQLMLDGLKEMEQRNGERPHHDSLHPLDVARKGYEELEERAALLDRTLTPLDYEALGLASIYHDIDVSSGGEETPEARSAAYIQAKMRKFSVSIYPEHQITRVGNLVIATTAQYIGDKVLQPMATEIPPDFCAPSILYGDVGEVTHEHWSHTLLTATRVAAEELYKLKIGDDPLEKVMGIFDKQDTFSDLRFEEWPQIIRYHCGEEEAEIYLQAKREELANQRRLISADYLAPLKKVRGGLANACKLIIENGAISNREKGEAFFRAAMTLLLSKKG